MPQDDNTSKKPWFRWYRDTTSDVKLKLVSMRASDVLHAKWREIDPDDPPVNVRDVLAVWIALLEVTDSNGNVTVTSPSLNTDGVTNYISTLLDLGFAWSEVILCAMVDHGLLLQSEHGFQIKKWKSRQYVDATNAERQARHRRNAKSNAQRKQRNGVTVTPTETETETETEKENKEKKIGANAPHPSDREKAFGNWNKIAEANNLKKAVGMSKERQKKLDARLKEVGIKGWNQALTNLEDMPFCLGENDRGWKVTFDWMLSPSNLVKIIEMNYEREEVRDVERSPRQK
jgi:hypothetical protein